MDVRLKTVDPPDVSPGYFKQAGHSVEFKIWEEGFFEKSGDFSKNPSSPVLIASPQKLTICKLWFNDVISKKEKLIILST